MAHEPLAGGESGYVVCVGLSLGQVTEIARLLRGQGVVLATADTEGARALLRRNAQAGPSLTAGSRPASGRGQPPLAQTVASRAAPLVRGPLTLDPATREVTAHGRRIHLSVREFDLLAVLASRVDRVWSFAELTATVWNSEYLGDPDPVTSAVKRLRKRLTAVHDLEVASVRGVGYRLMVPS